jgi:pimeloyl-ACP methyl ester carboxylesterase
MSYFEFQGYRVFFREEGAGDPIVFLHNGGNDHRIWDCQMEHFAKTHRVFALDHLGFGNSDKPDIEYTLPLYAAQLTAFIDGLNLAPVTLVGHCIGAAMALAYTLQNPSKVRALVLFNTATECTLVCGPLRDVYRNFRGNPEARARFVESIDGQLPPEAVSAALRQQIANPTPEFERYMTELWNRPGQMRSLYSVLANFHTWATLDTIRKPEGLPPVALFWSGGNQILPLQAGLEFRDKLQPDHFEVLEGANHMVMREKPEEVNAKLEAFLGVRVAGR